MIESNIINTNFYLVKEALGLEVWFGRKDCFNLNFLTAI